jgi:hypothetical protein
MLSVGKRYWNFTQSMLIAGKPWRPGLGYVSMRPGVILMKFEKHIRLPMLSAMIEWFLI